MYTQGEWEQAQANTLFLAAHARRGRGAAELAVLLFANGFPVVDRVVVDAVRTVMAAADVSLRRLHDAARRFGEDADGWGLPAAFETSSAVSKMLLKQRADLVRLVRSNLRAAGLPHASADVETVLVACVSAASGAPPEQDDPGALSALLFGFGAQGLLASPAPGVDPVVPGGVAGFGDAMARASRAVSQPLLADVTGAELEQARAMLRDLSIVFRAVPKELLPFIGGPALTGIWQPLEPVRIAQAVTWAVNAARMDRINPGPILEAARAAGWLPTVTEASGPRE